MSLFKDSPGPDAKKEDKHSPGRPGATTGPAGPGEAGGAVEGSSGAVKGSSVVHSEGKLAVSLEQPYGNVCVPLVRAYISVCASAGAQLVRRCSLFLNKKCVEDSRGML